MGYVLCAAWVQYLSMTTVDFTNRTCIEVVDVGGRTVIQKPDTSNKDLWNAGAFSEVTINSSTDRLRGVRCKPIHPTFRNVRVMLGLTSGAGAKRAGSPEEQELKNPH